MPALVESMFYVSNEENQRFKPWHGLGEPVEETQTSADALIKAGLDWEVKSNPIYDINGNVINGFKANTRDTDNSILGIVSDKYQIIQNRDAFAFTDALLGEDVRYETAGSLKNGKTIWLLAKMPTTQILDDDIEPYMCFMNTHDGTGAVKICMTPVRVVCNNTLNFALNTAKRTWSTKHMGDISSRMDEAERTLQLARYYMKELGKKAEELANIKVTDADFEHIFDALYPVDKLNDTERKIKNIITMKENLFKCYMANDIRVYMGTAYGVLNAVADYVAHTAPSRMTSSYQENNMNKIITGHQMLDNFYNALTTM